MIPPFHSAGVRARRCVAGAGRLGLLWLAWTLGVPGARTAPGAPWEAMDYGPFLSATVEAPSPRTNLAYKGVALPFRGEAEPGGAAGLLFDTDLLRMSAGWTGGFLQLKGVAFDGEHWAWPRIDGRQGFGNPMLPGWAHRGSFEDPRTQPYGPLPRSHGQWRGLHVQGDQVVLDYRVGDMDVLERPSRDGRGGGRHFVRTLNLGPSAVEQILQVAYEPGRAGAVRPGTAETGGVDLAVLPPREAPGPAPQTMPSNAGLIEHWDFDAAGEGAVPSRVAGGRTLALKGARIVPGGREGRGLALEPGQFAVAEGAGADWPIPEALSVAAWVRASEDGVVWARADSGWKWVPGGVALFLRGGRPTFDVGWVGAVAASRSVADGEWHHLAVVWDRAGGAVSLYVDGQVDGRGSLASGTVLAQPQVRVGFASTNFPAAPGFRGTLDDLRVYGRALAESEVRALAGPGPAQELVAASVTGAPPGAAWMATGDGHLRLRLPPSERPVRFQVRVWRGEPGGLAEFAREVKAGGATPSKDLDLEPLTRGGPGRWTRDLATRVRTGAGDGPFAVDDLAAPDDNPWRSWMRFGAVDLFPDGDRAAVSTWNGDVWVVSGLTTGQGTLQWRRIASGLYQPLGLKIADGRLYVLGRDQMTVLEDRNGDGETDFYRCFNHDGLVGEHFHEFATDLKLGPDGNFYFVKCARHALPAAHAHHGTLLRVTRDGTKLEVVARGFRAVNGLGVGPRGEFTTIDNQGHWMPANRLNWVEPGGWYGNQFAWNPDGRTDYDPPLCWMHNFVDRSGGTQLWVPDGNWGPLGGGLITISYGMGHLFSVLRERVDGVMQGAVTRLPFDFETGVMRGVFHPGSGDLYLCGLYGWAGNKTRAGGFYRIRATGRPLRVPTAVNAARDGLLLTFSEPLEPAAATDPARFDLKAWNYRWSANYGSPDLKQDGSEGRDSWPVASVRLSADRRRLFLEVPSIRPVMQYHLVYDLRAEGGEPVQGFLHGSLHRLGASPGAPQLGEGTRVGLAGNRGPARAGKGLVRNLARADGTGSDVDVVRQAALHVAPGHPVSPWFEPGAFRARWVGFLRVDLPTEVRFLAEGRGSVRVRIEDREVLRAEGPQLATSPGPRVPLRGGPNRVEVEYESPAGSADSAGTAEFRLLWDSPRTGPEPIPATAWIHDADDPALAPMRARDRGRTLAAAHQCTRCHGTESAPNEPSMPELTAEGPVLDGLGSRLREDWIRRWILDPQAHRAEARMPRVLGGSVGPAEAEAEARDLAAALARPPGAGLPGPSPDRPPARFATEAVAAGARWYAEQGCAGCHALPGEPGLPDDTRVSLAGVADKWLPEALPAFLRQPARHHPGTRMPDFGFSDAEAEGLAAFLLDRTRAGWKAAVESLPPGNPERGRELLASRGCLNCHALEGRREPPRERGFAALAEGARAGRGCLSAPTQSRGRAPGWAWSDGDRAALASFLAETGASQALLRDPRDRRAGRLVESLRCAGCHARDDVPGLITQVTALAAAAGSGAAQDEEELAAAGTVHAGVPGLSFAGEKLYAGWMHRLLSGALPSKTRPGLAARMPAFGTWAPALASGLAAEQGFGDESAPALVVDPALAAVGRDLTRVEGGFGCVACHDVGSQRALAGKDTATVNFASVGERLRPEYYWRYLRDPARVLPATMMPRFIGDDGTTPIKAVMDGDPVRQFGAIWQFLHSLRVARPPGASVPESR